MYLTGKVLVTLSIVLGVSQISNTQIFRRRDDGNKPPGPISLLPVPNGPFYGFPFDTRLTLSRFLPFTVSGMCEAGKVYTIAKPEDFSTYASELECVFNAARAPSKVPEGALYSKVLTAVNTQLFNQFMTNLWTGKLINKTECNGTTTYIGWNNIGNHPASPFVASIRPLQLNLAPAEFDDGQNSLILDSSHQLTQMCPEYRAYLQKNYGSAVVRGAHLTDFGITNQLVEAIRFVGKQQDGSSIYIGKVYLKDYFRDDKQAATIAFFSIVNFDKDVNPLSIPGAPMLPLFQGFKYMFPGIVDLMFRLNPIDNFITTPVRTFGKLVRGALRIGQNGFRFARNLPFGYRSVRQNSQNFRSRFYSDVQNARRQI